LLLDSVNALVALACLNPFEFRAWLLPPHILELSLQVAVSIPSNSGLGCFEQELREQADALAGC
jgi:hypothetical protein